MSTRKKHRILVVGGLPYNIPKWAHHAFEIDLIEGCSSGGTGPLVPKTVPDAVVIRIDFVSHGYSEQAVDFARSHSIPWFTCRGGWSSVIERAVQQGIDWFADAIQSAGEELLEDGDENGVEVTDAVDNAWKTLADYERRKAHAAETRLGKERRKREKAEEHLRALRSGAEQRIISAIRQQAQEVRESELSKLASIREAATKVVKDAEATERAVETALERLRQSCEVLRQLLAKGGEE